MNEMNIFFIGENLSGFRNEVIEILNRGHKIGNHSYTHPIFSKLSLDKAIHEVEKTDNIIREYISYSNQDPNQEMFFRYPYGIEVTKEKREDFELELQEMKLKKLFWTVDTNDWRKRTSIENIYNKIKESKKGDIVLAHDREKILKTLKHFK